MIHLLFDLTPYFLNPLAIQTFVVALVLFSLGLFSLIRGEGAHVSVVFFVLTLSIGVWFFGFSWMYSSRDPQLAMWWARVGHVGIAFIPAAANHFSALMVEGYEKARKRVLAGWIISVLFVLVNSVTDIQFASLNHFSWGFYPRYGMTSIPFLLYFSGIMLMALRGFVAGYRTGGKGSAQRMRARTLLIAFGAGVFAAFDFVPSFGIALYPFGYVPMFFFTIIAARSIFFYRFRAITPAFAARQITDTMNDALIVLDPDGVVRLVNRATCSLFGYREQELVGKRPAASMVRSTAFVEKLESIIGRGTVSHIEVDYQPQTGTSRTLSVSTSIMAHPSGEPLAIVCVVSDITDHKRAEEERERLIAELQEANQKLKTIDKLKSEFVSVVSHELRTPLTTIKAFAELLMMKPGMPEQQRTTLVSTINTESDSLTRLISALLDLARIEAGSIKWRVDKVSLEDIIRNAVSNMHPLLENKGLHLTITLDSPLPDFLGDRDRLRQVITNLLSNAVKFTPAGGTVRIAGRQESDPVAQIAVEISDTGIGIPAEDLELIFEKFHRSGDQQAGTVEGTGLGLAIARQIIEHHGGRIWAVSTLGKGSSFTFTLPLVRNEFPAATSLL